MASIRRATDDGCYGRNSLPQSEATPQPYIPEHGHANVPPPLNYMPEVSVRISFGVSLYRICLEHDGTLFEAALPMHCSVSGTQWNSPTQHSSVLEQRYYRPEPYVNDMARRYNVWTDAQQCVPFAPATTTASITLY
jgi:hypothetical protein